MMLARWIESIHHAHAFTDMLFAGDDPAAARLLPDADVGLVRDALTVDERLEGYAIGRVLGAGRGVWFATSKAVLLSWVTPFDPLVRVPLADITQVECERGRYGYTVRLHTTDGSHSLHGVAPLLAIAMHRLLGARVPAAPMVRGRALTAEDSVRALQCFADAAARTQPLTTLGPSVRDTLSTRAQAAHAGGWLGADELRAVQERLAAA